MTINNNFNKKIIEIKDWCLEKKTFILLLTSLFVSLIVSIFTFYALILVVLILIIGAVLLKFEESLSFFMFCYSFESVFFISINSVTKFIFPIIYSILFSISFIKYLILLFNKKERLNIKRIIPFLLFIIYILIPINPIKLEDIIKYIIAFGVIYLILEYRTEINFNNILIIASVGLILSIIITPLSGLSNRMNLIQKKFYNFNIEKFKAMFDNPNWFAVFSITILSNLTYKFIYEDLMWGIPILMIFPFSYRTISRDYILCLIFIIVFLLIINIIKRKKIYFLRYITLIAFIFIIAIVQLNITKLYAFRIKNTYNEITTLLGIKTKGGNFNDLNIKENVENNNNQYDGENSVYWVDGTPIDPGRLELWKRYIRDFKSSNINIIFGVGASAKVLGIAPHNTYINVLWQFGIFGTILLINIFYLIIKDLSENKNILLFLTLFVVLFVCMFESNVFNYVAIMMIISLYCSSFKGEKLNGKEENFDNSSDLQSWKISR